jgi:hypothetical protein
MKRIVVIAVVLVAACCSDGHSYAQQVERIYDLQLPPHLGAFKRGGDIRNYEASSPGLGYSAAYHKPGWTMTVYFYDKGLKAIGNGITDASVTNEQASSKQDIVDAGKKGSYHDVEWIRDFHAPDAGEDSQFICSHFELKFEQGAPLQDSFACLTGWKNRFVKLRLSGLHDAKSITEARMAAEGWMQILTGANAAQ